MERKSFINIQLFAENYEEDITEDLDVITDDSNIDDLEDETDTEDDIDFKIIDDEEEIADEDDADNFNAEEGEVSVSDELPEEETPSEENITAESSDNNEAEALKKELARIKNLSKEALEKLGIEVGDDIETALETASAEAEGLTLEEYRAKKAEEQSKNQGEENGFNELTNDDLSVLKRTFPKLADIKSIMEAFGNIDSLLNFGKLRDSGVSVKQAYIAVNGEQKPVEKKADNKQHINSAVPKKATDSSIPMPKSELKIWQDLFPNKSNKELYKLWKNTLN